MLVNTSAQKSYSIQAVKSRLDVALTRLESSVDEKLLSVQKSDPWSKELAAAKAEVSKLRQVNLVTSSRLDAAIDRIREIVEN